MPFRPAIHRICTEHFTSWASGCSRARALLVDTGMAIAREDLALEAAYWAQLPGHFTMRARRAPITTRNFAALSAWHNYPRGRARGNHWGEALTLLKTSAGSPFYFSLHASDPSDAEAPAISATRFCAGRPVQARRS